MCGICGIIDYKNNKIEEQVIKRMCSKMTHRGPDDEGIYISSETSPCVGLGHRRLKIIDLSDAGHQPMSNEDGTIWLVLNGEIYNYKELRFELENKGHKFKSNTDTETIVHLYEEYGEDCVKSLRGMFAFAIWDEKRQFLFAARDRVGKKPFVYSYDNGKFCFASELNALLASGYIKKEINFDAVDYYLTFGYIPAPITIYKDVFKLLPAHYLLLKEGKIVIKRYWDLNYREKILISEDDAAGEIMRLLKEATKIRLYSDVPLGAFLSGGIDSSTVVALMSQLSNSKVKTFSIGFEEAAYNELTYARNVARRFGTEHHEFIVKPKALEILPLLVERYGEPYADSSCIPTYYVAKETRQYVTVALNGDGGDESFAGYERYQAMLLAGIYRNLPSFIRKSLGILANIIPDSIDFRSKTRKINRFVKAADLPAGKRYARWVSVFNEEFKKQIYTDSFLKSISPGAPIGLIDHFFSCYNKENSLDLLLYTDVMTYLPNDLLVKMDIATMANSLEGRSPFLDHKVMEFAAKLPQKYRLKNFVKKYILKKAIKGVIPNENIHRGKMGFGIPVGEWFRKDLKPFLIETILSKRALERGYFKPEILKVMIRQHTEEKSDYSFHLWSLLMLELWHQRFMD